MLAHDMAASAASASRVAGDTGRAFPSFPFVEDFDDDPAESRAGDARALPAEQAAAEPASGRAPPGSAAPEFAALAEEAYARGCRDGRAEAATARDDAVRQTLTAIAGNLAAARAEAVAVAEDAAERTAGLVLGALAAMMPALCARHGAADAAALVRAVVPALAHVPRVTIRVSPHARAAVEAALAFALPEGGPEIRLVATDAMSPGDARLSWHEGHAERRVAELWREVVDALAPLGLPGLLAEPAFNVPLPLEAAHV